MAPHLELISGGKLSAAASEATPAERVIAEVELTVARYVMSMLIQLEAVSRLVKIDGLANSLGLVRQEACEIVRQLDPPE